MSIAALIRRHGLWAAGILYLLLSASIIFTLRPWVDEAWNASPALNLLNHGYLGSSSIEPVTFEALRGIDRHWYVQTPLYPVALAGWFAIAGQGLIQQRLFTLLQGVVVLASLLVLLRRLTSAAWLAPAAVAILCLDYFYVRRSSDGRYDMLCACLGFAGLAAYMAWRERSGPLAVLAGSAGVVGAAMAHAVGIIYGAQLLYLVLRYDRRRIRWSWVAAAAAPALVAALLWGRFILEAPQDFRVQFFHEIVTRAGFLQHPLDGLIREIQSHYLFALGGLGEGGIYYPLRQLRAVILAVYLAGMAVVFASPALRRKWRLQPVVHLWVLGALMLLVIDNGNRPLYLVHILPWMAAMLAAGFGWAWIELPKARWAAATVAAVFVVLQVGGIASVARRNEWARVYRPVASYLQQNLRPGEMVIGGPEWGFALGFGDHLMDDLCLGYYSRKVPAYIVLDPRYHGQFLWYKQWQPDIFRFVDARLRMDYTLVDHVGVIEVYRRKSDTALN